MAYTSLITKNFPVKEGGADDFTASIHVLITDNDNGDAIVLDKDYSVTYNTNTDLADVKAIFQARFVADWQKFLSEKAIYDAVKFDTLVSELQTTANSYINS